MKGYKSLVPLVLIVVMLLSFYTLYNEKATVRNEYNNYLALARDNAEKGILVDAMENYSRALSINNTIDLHLEICDVYLKWDDISSALYKGEEIIATFPKDPAGYEFLIENYKKINDLNRCFSLYEVASKRKILTEKINKIYEEIKYSYYFGESFDEVGLYNNGLCVAKREDKWGLINEIGGKASSMAFLELGSFSDSVAPVKTEDGEYFFIDSKGNKKIVIQGVKNIFGVSPIVGGVFAINNGQTWAFYDVNSKKISGDYDDISMIEGNLAVVKKAGYWEIVDVNGKSISNEKYDEVKMNESNAAIKNGILFAGKENGYFMLNESGKKVLEKEFLDAKPFVEDSYAAVKTQQGWNFVNKKGDILLKDKYFEDARSFSNGFAAVKKDGRWGFVDETGEVIIDFIFEDARDFNSKACVFVKQEEVWQLLKLYSKNYEK